jgi:tetratricopeptide (TPR) repeat protein
LKDQIDGLNNNDSEHPKDSLKEEPLFTEKEDKPLTGINELSSNELIEYEKALELIDKLLMVTPDDPKLYYEKGFFFEIAQKYYDAIKCFEQAINLDKNYFEAWYRKGLALNNLEKYYEAIKSFEQALTMKPRNWPIRKSC